MESQYLRASFPLSPSSSSRAKEGTQIQQHRREGAAARASDGVADAHQAVVTEAHQSATGSSAMPSPVRHEAAREPSQVPRRGLRNVGCQVQVSGEPLAGAPPLPDDLPTGFSKVATARQGKVVRAKAPANPRAKVEEEEKRSKSGSPSTRSWRGRGVHGSLPTLNPFMLRSMKKNGPVHDDRKLFELLILSQALAELTWPGILNKREEFRRMFDGFNYASVSEFTEEKINLLLRSNGTMLLSEQKIRAVVTNAKQVQKPFFLLFACNASK